MTVSVKRQFVEGAFGQLHTRFAVPEQANRPAIICLHMSPKSGRLFAEVMPYLAQDRRVLAPDYPGHGESDIPPPSPHVTIEDFAQALWTVADHFDTGPVHLVGHHTGAMVAVEAASQRPNQVLSVVNIGAPVFTAEEQVRLTQDYEPLAIDESGNRFQIMWQRVLEHRGPGMTLAMAATSFSENLRAGDHYEWGHRAAFAYSPTYNQRLTELDHPVLVMNPADDCFEQSKRADAMLKRGRRIDYPQWGHGFLSAYPEQAAAEILKFAQDVECGDA
ncbi:MAG: alpha/beta fold hydrolase [Lysobacterales bacterium]